MTNANGYKSFQEDRVRNCIKGHIQIEKNEDDEKNRVSCNKEVHRSRGVRCRTWKSYQGKSTITLVKDIIK